MGTGNSSQPVGRNKERSDDSDKRINIIEKVTMPDFFINSLEIQNFRVFEHLKIERLGRINLIVGKNNVGKTCLLESLDLYANRGNPFILWNILNNRDETNADNFPNNQNLTLLKHVRHLLPRSSRSEQDDIFIKIKATSEENLFSIGFTIEQSVATIRIFYGKQGNVAIPEYENFARAAAIWDQKKFQQIQCRFIPAHGSHRQLMAVLWDRIASTEFEEDVNSCLRLLNPEIQRVNFIVAEEYSTSRIPIVKIQGLKERIPLRNLGEGMNRLFGIALALVNAKDGWILIDEIESGFHYSIQPDVWKFIFEVAERLNVQVFATTHSWDCIDGFQRATQENPEVDALLIRLRQKKENIRADLFDRDSLKILVRDQLEVR
ncbi:AAA family ATPase [Deltaproteobacteria bacterium TL4]